MTKELEGLYEIAKRNELRLNQKIRNIVNTLEINEEIDEHKAQGYYSDSEIMIFLKQLKKAYRQHVIRTIKLSNKIKQTERGSSQ